MITPQQLDFASRISRIESGIGNSKSTIFVGLDESFQYNRLRSAGKKVVAGELRRALLYPLAVFAAFLLGVASNLIWRLVDFHVRGLPDPTANIDQLLLTNATISVVIAIVLGPQLGLKARSHFVMSVVGVAVGLCALHNVIHAEPQLFEALFSPGWVQDVVRNTDAHSVLWRGVSLPF